MAESGKNKPRPPMSKTKVRVQVVLEKKVVDKVDRYATKSNQSRSFWCAEAITSSVTEDAWQWDMVHSTMMKPLVAICRRLYGEKNNKKRKEYMEILDHMTRENLEEM